MQEGYIGLLEAAKHFNPELGVTFQSYAACWVRREIERAVRAYGFAMKIPLHIKLPAEAKPLALDAPIYDEDDDTITLADMLADGGLDAEEMLNREVQMRHIMQAVERLPKRRRTVMRKLYGIGEKEMTFAEVAQEMGMQSKSVMHIHEEAIGELKNAFYL